MQQRQFGYIRVSTRDQNEARQIDALAPYGIPPRNLYLDKQSGRDFQRPAWLRLMKRLRSGDLLVVKSIDRLGRNYGEILEQWRIITKEIGADILVVDMPLLDTRAQGRDLTGVFIADLVLQILSYVAQTERENTRQRQAEGIAAAKARGVVFGRPPVPTPECFQAVYSLWKNKELNSRQAAQHLNTSQPTFLKWARSFVEKR